MVMIYPLIIVLDRYSGAYSGGEYTAFNLEYPPKEIYSSDVECMEFWDTTDLKVGKGNTPEEAINNLKEVLK